MSKLHDLIKGAAGLCAVLFLGYLWLRRFEYAQVFHPDRTLVATGAELGRPFADAAMTASDGVQLHAWFFPANPHSPRSNWVVLLCHGNAGNISHRLESCEALLATGVNVLVFDYRGYGRSRGRPSETGTYLDAQAAYQWLRRKGFPANRIVAFGESLGGGVASELARREPLGALVLQSTFTSIPDVGAELFPWLPVRSLGAIKYDTHSRLPGLKLPVMIMHSRTDELLGFHHAQRNFAAANDPKRLYEISGGHNNPLTNRKQFIDGIEQFLLLVERE